MTICLSGGEITFVLQLLDYWFLEHVRGNRNKRQNISEDKDAPLREDKRVAQPPTGQGHNATVKLHVYALLLRCGRWRNPLDKIFRCIKGRRKKLYRARKQYNPAG